MPVTTWTAGQVLAAQDLNDTFASKLNIAGGKILQIVRATDSTSRSTTSTSFVDANSSVTITPQKSDSAIVIIFTANAQSLGAATSGAFVVMSITDSSNNPISGAQRVYPVGSNSQNANADMASYTTLVAYATPATTSAVTYKARFMTINATNAATLINADATAQMYAIEVSA